MMNELDMILDIPVKLTVELGRTKITIKNLLQLAHGSVVELDAMAGEPMDVLVNGTLIAQGEVVVVNDKFGIRLTDIITPSERMRKLNRYCGFAWHRLAGSQGFRRQSVRPGRHESHWRGRTRPRENAWFWLKSATPGWSSDWFQDKSGHLHQLPKGSDCDITGTATGDSDAPFKQWLKSISERNRNA
jgi:flagellar motor switch protein FliN